MLLLMYEFTLKGLKFAQLLVGRYTRNRSAMKPTLIIFADSILV